MKDIQAGRKTRATYIASLVIALTLSGLTFTSGSVFAQVVGGEDAYTILGCPAS